MLFGNRIADDPANWTGDLAICQDLILAGESGERRRGMGVRTLVLATSVLLGGGSAVAGTPDEIPISGKGDPGMKSVSLTCTDAPRQMCETFETLVQSRHPDIAIVSPNESDADLSVELIRLEKTDHTMSARLKWQDAMGAVDGPMIDFRVSDAVISEQNYQAFLMGLLIGSKAPF